MTRWYEDRENLFQLAQELEEVGGTITSEFLEKPWKWQSEWDYFKKHGNLTEFEE